MSSKIKEFIEKNIMTPLWGKELKLVDYFKEEDFIQDEEGHIFVKLDALNRVSRKVFERIVVIGTDLKQQPLKTNDYYAVVKVSIEFVHNGMNYVYSAHADCYKGNTPSGRAGNYYVGMAESRALSRALRGALGVPACSAEEVAEIADLNSVVQMNGPIEPTQKLLIEKKFMLEKEKTLDDISKIVGKTINSLDHLTKEEAASVILNFNKSK